MSQDGKDDDDVTTVSAQHVKGLSRMHAVVEQVEIIDLPRASSSSSASTSPNRKKWPVKRKSPSAADSSIQRALPTPPPRDGDAAAAERHRKRQRSASPTMSAAATTADTEAKRHYHRVTTRELHDTVARMEGRIISEIRSCKIVMLEFSAMKRALDIQSAMLTEILVRLSRIESRKAT